MSFELAIHLSGVSKIYRQFPRPSDRLWQALFSSRRNYYTEFTAVSDIGFSLKKGEVLGVVGVNGAGKSTLLQLIAGTIQPTLGTVQTKGRIAALLELGSGFNPEFTGRENIYLNAATLGLSKREIDQKIDAIIAFADIGAHVDQPVKTYSSGMHVRLAFSIATSVEPDILIVDEALSVGDGAFARRSFDRIMQIKEQGATVLFCSHTLFHIEVFCDRALWLHQGHIRQYGAVTEVLTAYQDFLDTLSDPKPTEAASQNHTVDTIDPTKTSGPSAGHARIEAVEVALDSHQGTELYGESGQSTLAMKIHFRSDPQQPAPSAALVVSSDSGKILATHISANQGISFERDPTGSGTAEITVPGLPFNKGRYRIGAYLLCERGLHVYQWIDPVAHVQLHHTTHDQGTFLIQGQWKDAND